MKLTFFRGVSKYSVWPLFEEGLTQGLRRLGHEVEALDLAGPDLNARCAAALSGTEAVLSFNLTGIELLDEPSVGPLLAERPFVGLTLDHPAYLLPRLRRAGPLQRVGCVDSTHADFILRYLGEGPVVSTVFHGACLPPAPTPGERDVDLLLAGSYEAPEVPAAVWRQGEPGTVALFEELAEASLALPSICLEAHLSRALARRGVRLDSQQLMSVFTLSTCVDRYVRAVRRTRLLEVLDAAGLCVDVYGEGWEPLAARTRHRFHGQVAFATVLERMQRAKVVVNAGPNFPTGSHERVLTAMACGAATATDHTRFFSEAFEDGRHLVGYDPNDLGALCERLRRLLDQPAEREELAAAGRAEVLEHHTWAARAGAVEALLQAPRGSA